MAETKADMRPEADRWLVAVLLIFAISTTVYANSLANGFVYDDEFLIVNNPWIKEPGRLVEAFTSGAWAFDEDRDTNHYRPLMHLYYALSYHLFGAGPGGFHLFYIIFHGAVSVAVYLMTRRVMEAAGTKGAGGGAVPVIAGVLFAVHPIHTQIVAWNGVHEMSLTLFFLLALIFFLNGRHRLVALFFFLSCLSKETALALPIIFIAADLLFKGGVRGGWGPFIKRHRLYLAAGVVYIAMRSYAIGGVAPVLRHTELGLYGSLINAPVLFVKYLWKLVLPTDLSAFYTLHPVASPMEAAAAGAAILTVLYGAALVYTARRSALVFLALLITAVPLLPVLYIPVMGESPFSEGYLYLPSIGFSIICALIILKVSESVPAEKDARVAVLMALVISVTAAYSFATIKRNPVWRTNTTLFMDMAEKAPDHAYPLIGLGNALYVKGDYWGAAGTFEAALKIDKDHPAARSNLGISYAMVGEYGRAAEELGKALRLMPDAEGFYNLGLLYERTEREVFAADMYRRALDLKPDFRPAKEALKERSALDTKEGEANKPTRVSP